MRKRISLLIAALMLALTMSFGGAGVAFAKHAQEGPQGSGCTTQYQGNSPNSPVISSSRGGPNSQSDVSCTQ